jgi:hypothetical protein
MCRYTVSRYNISTLDIPVKKTRGYFFLSLSCLTGSARTLDEHIKQTEILAKHKAIYKRYMEQKPKDRDRFHETHRAEITLYEAANRYIKEHLNGRTAIPLRAWKAERAKLTGEQSTLAREYKSLKGDVREVETIRRYAESVERTVAPPQKARKQGLEL